jgi:hypothetical protein
MSDDIVARLRGWRGLHLARLGELFDEAADEITRLRGDAEIARLRLEAAHGEVTGNAREPVAWAAVGKNGQPMWLSYSQQDAEGAVVGMADVVPLYRSPTLTDEEREAIACAAESYADNDDDEDCARVAATLRGVIERLG